MRILVVSERFWPRTDPRAIRWGAICRRWGTLGHEVRVICGPARDAMGCMPRVEIHRVGWGGILAAKPTATVPSSRRTAGVDWRMWAWGTARRVRDATWKRLWWPDYACLWQRQALACAQSMISHWEPEALVTVSNPYSCHLVGLAIRKQQPGIRWLADIGDPFSLEEAPAVNNRALFSERNRRLEQQVFEQANVVSVTTEATARAYAAAIPSTRKAIVIPPLVDSEIGPPPVEVKSDGVKRLVFCGRLYSQLRGPGPLLAAFGRFVEQHPVPRWELHLYGEVEECRH